MKRFLVAAAILGVLAVPAGYVLASLFVPAPAAHAAVIGDAPVVTTPETLAQADVTLVVKVKQKDCFGSAGCNVRYGIAVTLGAALPGITDSCDITYEVHGLVDAQIGTLTVNRDGAVKQTLQRGETDKGSAKLKATVTDVTCA